MKKSRIIKILGILPLLSLGLFLKYKELDPLIGGSFPCLEQRQSPILTQEVFFSARNLSENSLMRSRQLLSKKHFLQESEAICQLSVSLPAKFIPARKRMPASTSGVLNRHCQEDSFFEQGADGARARQFLHPQIHKLHFALKADLGCIKDQGNRNTSLAFATLGAVELQLRREAGLKVNLSEQHFYAQAKLRWLPSDWSSPRYFGDALPSVSALKRAIQDRYQFQPGSAWRYNPSLKRTQTTYPTNFYTNSCKNFSGDCSDTNHQGKMISCPMGMLNENFMWCKYQLPQAEPMGFAMRSVQGLSVDHQGLLTSQLILQNQPLLTSLMVTRSFLDSRDGLIEEQESEELFGAQQLLVVGYVDSSELPSELEARASGYYIVKNSWGENWGWRGYGIVSEDYIRRYSAGFIQINLARSEVRSGK